MVDDRPADPPESFTIFDVQSATAAKIAVRRLPRLLLSAMRVVWAAGRAELVTVTVRSSLRICTRSACTAPATVCALATTASPTAHGSTVRSEPSSRTARSSASKAPRPSKSIARKNASPRRDAATQAGTKTTAISGTRTGSIASSAASTPMTPAPDLSNPVRPCTACSPVAPCC